MRIKPWLVPLALALLAIVLVISGIAWEVASGVAIPDQDPTPAIQAHARFHMRTVNVLLLAGVASFLAAAASGAFVLIRRASNRRPR